MNKLKIFSIGACVALCMGFASCENDEPCDCEQIKDESGISTEKEVDLGLPSGTIWAGWNVGASSPEQLGDPYSLYDWGKTDKSEYSDIYSVEDLPSNISGTQYDMARHKWGSSWRMPTKEDWEELILNCNIMHFQSVFKMLE